MKPIKYAVDNQFLKNLVKEQLLEQKKEKEDNDWWGSTVNVIKQTFHSTKRWSNKKLYDNNREQAVANIKSSDPDVEQIKDFFSLYSEVSYEGSSYASAFKSSWAIEDPGTYSLQDDTKNKLDSWRAENKPKFLKEMMKAEKENESVEDILNIIEDYVDDFCSTFDYYGLRIEAGAKRLTVPTNEGMNLMKACIKIRPGLLKDWRSQWHGSKICIIDTFPHLFKFIWDLNTGKQTMRSSGSSGSSGIEDLVDDLDMLEQLEPEKQKKVFPGPVGSDYPDISEVLSSANVVRSTQKISAAVEMQKKSNFVRKLRADSGLRKKWTGFCYNMTFDPYGEHDLQYWTTDAQALKTKSQKTTADQYLEMGWNMAGWAVADVAATMAITKSLRAIRAARVAAATASVGAQAAAGGGTAVQTGGLSILVTVVTVGVTLLISFDPFEWFSIRDDIEEEYESLLKNLIALNKLVSSSNPRSSTEGRAALAKIQKNISKSFLIIIRLLHETMEDGLQREISNIKTQMDVKKNLLGNLSSSIQTARQQMRALDFTKREIDAGEISKLVTFCRETIKQLKNIGAEEAKWDNKIKRDTNLGRDIKSIESVNENLLLERSSSIFNDAQVKKVAKIIKQRYGMDILSIEDENAAMSLLQRARDINVSFSSKKQKSMKEKYAKAYDYLDDSDPGNLNSQASAFADWWGSNFGQNRPEETSTKTIYNSAWVQSALGLKSSTYYGNNSLTRDGIGNSLEAYCGIGLSHALGNTSFYYTQDFGKIIGASSSNVREKFLSKSEIRIQNGAPVVVDKKPYIQSLRVVIKDIDTAGQRDEIKQVVSKISSAIKSEENKAENMKLRILNLMAKVYYNFELDGVKLAESLLVADDKLTEKMKSLSIQLAGLPPAKQNTAEHALLLSNLRQAAGWKIMLFQAIMNIGQ